MAAGYKLKMDHSKDWRDKKYSETFEEETRGLIRRKQFDPDCKIEDIEGILKSLYIMDGADWGGRGDLQDITIAATIAAYESFINQWKTEPVRQV
jgi:hypothetical protein